MEPLFIDFESYSELSLPDVGAYKYVTHQSTEPLLLSYAFGDEDVQVVDLTRQRLPERIIRNVDRGCEVVAHGDFDRILWNATIGACKLRLSQYTSTIAMALEVALPAKLSELGAALKLTERKDPKGKALIKRFCMPGKGGQRPVWDGPEWDHFKDYARDDVRTMRAAYYRMPPLDARERTAYELDQEINARGLRLDVAGVVRLKSISTSIVERLNQLTLEASGGKVETIDKLPAMKSWLGVESITKDTLPELIERHEGPKRRVLEYRQLGAKASTKKLDAMLDAVEEDQRVRGVIVFCGAHTRRWSGRLIQPQNFPRECLEPQQVDDAITLSYREFVEVYPDPLTAVSQCLRGMIVAGRGNVLLDADYNAIEVRVLCWYAGQNDILELYRKGGDVYMEMARAIGQDATRHLGKTIVLGSGYMLGKDKCYEDLKAKGFDLTLRDAKRYIDAYRERFHRVRAFWYALRDATVAAVLQPGTVQRVGRVKMTVHEGKLLVRIANGNLLYYYEPRVEWVPAPWDDEERVQAVTFTDHQSRGTRFTLTPGTLTNNIVQSTSREIMLEGMLNVRHEYPIVLTVHDQIVSEVEREKADAEDFAYRLVTMPAWADGLPLKAECKIRERWGK